MNAVICAFVLLFAPAPAAPVELDGLVSTPPADWEAVPVSGMRVAQWTLKPAKADEQQKTEVVIFHFGKGSGGSAADNVTRWKGMFEGGPEAKVSEETIAGAKATLVELSGTYLFRARPMDTSPPEKRPDHRMVAVVWETPNGPYYLRLVGPGATVTHHEPAFLKWLRGFKKK